MNPSARRSARRTASSHPPASKEARIETAWKLYKKTVASVWKLYQEVEAPARKLYEETRAKIEAEP